MKFANLTPPYLADAVAVPVAKHCKKKFGGNGFKTESEISRGLPWRPTIQLKTSQYEVLAVEVTESIGPAAALLKATKSDLLAEHSDKPIVVFVACPLAEYQADQRHSAASGLRSHGFGLLTVDDVGTVIEQIPAIPLIHHVPEPDIVAATKGLPVAVRTKMVRAYDVYRTSSYQGLQDAAQVIEAIVFGFANDAMKKGWIPKVRNDVADVLDDLYFASEQKIKSQRAAIGSARGFIKYYRNVSSHPPKTSDQAADRIKKCRHGFLTAFQVADAMTKAVRSCGLNVKLMLP